MFAWNIHGKKALGEVESAILTEFKVWDAVMLKEVSPKFAVDEHVVVVHESHTSGLC